MAAPALNRSRSRHSPVPQNNYTVYGIFVILLTLAVSYGGYLSTNFVEEKKQNLEDLQTKHTQLATNLEQLQKQVQRTQPQMQLTYQKAELWKKSDKKLNQPWTINAAEWLALLARDQQPPITDEGRTSEAAIKGRNGRIEMRVSGEFRSLLNWLMQAEHQLDVVRIIRADWTARNPQMIELSLTIEVANE